MISFLESFSLNFSEYATSVEIILNNKIPNGAPSFMIMLNRDYFINGINLTAIHSRA